MIQGQGELLSEAFANLVDNAIRYTPRGGRVILAVDAAPPSFSVADSGPGIASDEIEKVFERFVRGRGMTNQGSGLGLALVKEIASLHGAQVQMGVAPQLGGTCATIRFRN
jgi:signal transduction histidine kinase